MAADEEDTGSHGWVGGRLECVREGKWFEWCRRDEFNQETECN